MLLEHMVVFMSENLSKLRKFLLSSIKNPVNCCSDVLQVPWFLLNCAH